jgi:hypothetical protein
MMTAQKLAEEFDRGGKRVNRVQAVRLFNLNPEPDLSLVQVHPGRLHPKGITDARPGVQPDDDRDQLVHCRHVCEPHPFGHRQGYTLLDLLFDPGLRLLDEHPCHRVVPD